MSRLQNYWTRCLSPEPFTLMNTAALISQENGINQRFNLWILERVRRRRGTPELPFTLEYRHIYVMPTMFGFWFGVLLALTAIGGLNFNNNMVLILAFVMAAIAQMTSVLAYRNLSGMTLLGFRASPVFAGQAARFTVLLKNPEERLRFAIQLVSSESSDCTDIKQQATGRLELELITGRRGWIEMEPFRIENRYPLGLFRAWSVIIPKARCLVYPAPVPNPPPLPKTGRGDLAPPGRVKANICMDCVNTNRVTPWVELPGGPARATRRCIPRPWRRPVRMPANSTGI